MRWQSDDGSENKPSLAVSLLIYAVCVSLVGWLRLGLYRENVVTLTYALPLLLCLWHRDKGLLWSMTITFAFMAWVKALYLLSGDAPYGFGRMLEGLMQLANLLVTAVVVHLVLNLFHRLGLRNAQLKKANDDLQAKTERIASQNEELQSQASNLQQQNEELQQQTEELEQQQEELQSQAEELRTALEEVAQRESMLQSLLESVHGLRGEREVMDQICAALLRMMGERAAGAAVVERVDEELVVHAQAGLDDIRRERWAFSRSFAKLVMEHGRTGFVDDLAERPDLIVPEARERSFRSILASPLRIDGGAIGAVEVYAPQAQQWTREEFALIEWVAAQCGLILEVLRLQQAVRDFGEQRRLALEAAELGSWDYRFTTGEVFWDARCRDMFGVAAGSQLDYDSVIACIHPEERTATNEAVERAIVGVDDGAYHREYRVVWPDGSTHWIASHGRVFFEGEGIQRKAVRFIGASMDISERKGAEEALRASEANARAILDVSTESIFLFDTDSTVVMANATAAARLGRSLEEVVGKKSSELISPKLSAVRWKLINQAITSAQPVRFEDERDGIIFDHSVFPVLGEAGKVTGVAIFSRDVTERKRAEEELLRAKEQWERTFDSVPDLIAILDKEHRVVRVNEAMAQRLGRKAEECVGLPCYEVVHGASCPVAACPHACTMADGREHETELHEPLLAGDFLVSTTPMLDAKGEMVGSVHVARDITARKQHEERLRQTAEELARSNKDLEHFAYVASHDLQEPLRTVRAYTQLLQKRYQGNLDADADEFIRFIVEGAARMQRLITDLLAYSRVSSAARTLAPTPLEGALGEALAALRETISEAGARVTYDPLPTVLADRGQLTQLLQNLVGNGIKFQRQGVAPQVHVGLGEQDGHWVLAVRDNGIGIEPEYHEKIFTIFQRLHGVEQYSGTGIGLTICQRIVERHGGRIWLESQPGTGTTFFFSLPK